MFESFRRSNGLLPLLLGVTGHRDLRPEDLPALRQRVGTVLAHIRGLWVELQGKGAAPLYILSGMAAGADQLTAEVALEMDMGVIAVLPMPLEQYEEDFPEPREKHHLRSLVARASGVITIPEAGGTREAQYEAAGSYISRRCNVLIALWDGIDVDRIGGTSHVVRMKLSGADSKVDGPLPTLEMGVPGPVCHIQTSRKDSTPGSHPSIQVLQGEGIDEKKSTLENAKRASLAHDTSIGEAIGLLGRFNADWLRLAPKLGEAAKEGAENLVPSSLLSEDEKFLGDYYGIADGLSYYFQKQSIKMVNSYFWLLFLAGCFLEASYYFYPLTKAWENPGLDVIEGVYALLMVGVWSLYWWADHKAFHNRYYDYRALAEALRIQIFWRLAGLKESVADQYFAHQVGEVDWVCKALYAVALPLTPPKTSNFPALRKHWVESQLNYFESSVVKKARASDRFMKAGMIFLWLSLFWVFLRIAAPGLYGHTHEHWKIFVGLLFVLFASASPIALILFGYEHFRGFSEDTKRQLAMIPLFKMANRALSKPVNDDAGKKVVLQLGQEALAENGYWLILHHQQEFDLT